MLKITWFFEFFNKNNNLKFKITFWVTIIIMIIIINSDYTKYFNNFKNYNN